MMPDSPSMPPTPTEPATKYKEKNKNAGAALLVVYLLVVLVLAFGMVIAAWPYAEKRPSWLAAISAELRFVIVAACGGALGAAVHTLTKLTDAIVNRTLVNHWLYVIRVLMGLLLAMVVYLFVRGLLLAPQSEGQLNPYGILLISFAAGMYSTQVLGEVSILTSSILKPTAVLEGQIDRLTEALGGATLDNYQGFLCISYLDSAGQKVSFSDGGRPDLKPDHSYELIAWFQPSRPEEGFLANEVKIAGGSDAKLVGFKLIPDGDRISLTPPHETVTFAPEEISQKLKFAFLAPHEADPYDIWVEVFQKNRLVHAVSAGVNVRKPMIA